MTCFVHPLCECQAEIRKLEADSVRLIWKHANQIVELKDEITSLRSAAQVAAEALQEYVLGHEHAPDLPHTRAMGDNCGWCDYCHTKVTWGEDTARDALSTLENAGVRPVKG